MFLQLHNFQMHTKKLCININPLVIIIIIILDCVGRLVYQLPLSLDFRTFQKKGHYYTMCPPSGNNTEAIPHTVFPIAASSFPLHCHVEVLQGLQSEYTSLHHHLTLPCDLLWPMKREQDCKRPVQEEVQFCLQLSLTP